MTGLLAPSAGIQESRLSEIAAATSSGFGCLSPSFPMPEILPRKMQLSMVNEPRPAEPGREIGD